MTYGIYCSHFPSPRLFRQPDGGGGNGGDGGVEGAGGAGDGGGGAGAQANGGGVSDDWRSSLPDSIQQWDEAKNSDSPEKFWDQITNMRSFLGQSIRVPTEDAGEATWKEFHEKLQTKVPGLMPTPNLDDPDAVGTIFNRLGKPEKPDDYKVPEIDDKGVKLDQGPIKEFIPLAHKHNLTQSQFEGIVKDMTDANVAKAVEQQRVHSEAMGALRQEWGLKFDDNLQLAISVAENTEADPNLVAAIKNNQVSPNTLKWLVGLGKKFGGEGANLTQDRTDSGIMTPEEAKARISDIMNNREHAYWNVRHPEHQSALQEMLKLQKYANPDASTNLSDLRAGAVSARLYKDMEG